MPQKTPNSAPSTKRRRVPDKPNGLTVLIVTAITTNPNVLDEISELLPAKQHKPDCTDISISLHVDKILIVLM